MRKSGPYDFATVYAENLLRDELKITSLPVDPITIARDRGIVVEPMPPKDEGVSGMLIRLNNDFAIGYATHIKSQGFQRFSVGHELGHYFLPGHVDAVLPAGATHHSSNGGFVSDDRYELEADHFAAGLLMPSALFTAAMRKAGEGLDAIDNLAGRCVTSLTATAIRYQQLSSEAVAVIQAKGSRIEFCFVSDRMLSLKPGRWPRKGDPVPKRSATFRLNADPAKIAKAERADGPADGADWFVDFPEVDLFEETIGLGSYGRTLTVLTTVDALPDEDDLEEEVALDESWRPGFRQR
jgi:hypothetical protein